MNWLNLETAVAIPDCVAGARSALGLTEEGYEGKEKGNGEKGEFQYELVSVSVNVSE
jgi:hypothetical protein